MMKPTRWIPGLSALLLFAGLQPVQAQRSPDATVGNAIGVLSEVTRNPKTGMPRNVLRSAAGVAIIPEMFKASFIFGARFGNGVLLVKQPDGTWSNPVFIRLFGGSFGLQAGAQSTDLILVFQTPKGLERFLKGKGKMTLGVDAAVAAGPAGRRFEAATDMRLKSEILSYSNSRGIFAGASAEGATLQLDWRANTLYYGQAASPSYILAVNSDLAVPESTITLQQMLAEKTALPARVVTRRPRGTVVYEEGVPFYDGPARGQTVIREEPIDDDDEPAPRPRVGTRRRAPVEVDPSLDEDLESVPSDAEPRQPARRTRPRPANDEDLPEAAPEARPAAPRSSSKPRSSVKPEAEPEELPALEVPRTGSKPKSTAKPKVEKADPDDLPELDAPKTASAPKPRT